GATDRRRPGARARALRLPARRATHAQGRLLAQPVRHQCADAVRAADQPSAGRTGATRGGRSAVVVRDGPRGPDPRSAADPPTAPPARDPGCAPRWRAARRGAVRPADLATATGRLPRAGSGVVGGA